MTVEPQEFFREVTIRICGSLDVEQALYDTYLYLKQHLPVDEVTFTRPNIEMGAIQFVARASEEGGTDLGMVPMPLAPLLREPMLDDFLTSRCYYTNTPDNPLARMITSFRKIDPNVSFLVLRLGDDDDFIGSINLSCFRTHAYTDEHAKLMELLVEPCTIALSNVLRYREVLSLQALLEEDNQYLRGELKQRRADSIVGARFGLKPVMEMFNQVAGLDSPVLLLGETGTGKEVMAHTIHDLSPRRDGPFVTVNCGAIPDTMIDSELFGHEKGAFTGAVGARQGRFERANGGTIFLDEIGELPSDGQVRLLRVLQEREIERVGGVGPIDVDIRIVAATHRDLDAMVAEGRFREDLLFRLKVFPVTIPPLRERSSDIPALVQHFVEKKCRELGIKRIPSASLEDLDELMEYGWPGNVRELENLVERALILGRDGPLVLRAPGRTAGVPAPAAPPPAAEEEELATLDEAMANHIRKALARCDGKIEGDNGVAEVLGIKPNTLRARMKKLGVEFGRRAKAR